MPPRHLRSAQGSQNNPDAGEPPATSVSARFDVSLTPVPSSAPATPRGPAISMSSIERGTPGEEEPRGELPPSAEDHKRLNDLVASLQQQIENMRHNAAQSARHVSIEQRAPMREYSEAPTNVSVDGSRTKIKSSDLPKFYGKDNEDVDQWIEKVTAIYEYSNMRTNELMQHFPMILHGNALQWFTQLGARRHRFVTWPDWQTAIRNAFYMPNHKANLRRQCLYRTLKANESFADYYQDKLRLQTYVFPESTPDYDLITTL